MVSNSFRFTQKARDDLDETIEYIIKVIGDINAAYNLIADLEKRLETITSFPESCPVVENKFIKNTATRKANVKSYIMYYAYDKDKNEIVILRFIYGKRELDRILEG